MSVEHPIIRALAEMSQGLPPGSRLTMTWDPLELDQQHQGPTGTLHLMRSSQPLCSIRLEFPTRRDRIREDQERYEIRLAEFLRTAVHQLYSVYYICETVKAMLDSVTHA